MTLKLMATRDDGARLLGDENLECALLMGPDVAVITSVAAVATRGSWRWVEKPSVFAVPAAVEAKVRQVSAEFVANLMSKQPVPVNAR